MNAAIMSTGAPPAPQPGGALAAWLTGTAVALVFLASVALDIDIPGIFMDAVNPDYLVVSILNPGHQIERWVLPGNDLGGRFAILTSLYHGTGQMWLGLPFFAVLGTSVESLRLVHGLFGCAVLVAATLWLRRAGVPNVAIAAIGIAIALDPAFAFAYRTQGYIVLSPLAALLFSLVLLDRTRRDPRGGRWLVLSGILYGMALFGYFIYAFYLPALLAAVLTWPAAPGAGPSRAARLRNWIAGACCGAALYPVGYALIAVKLEGIGGLVAFIAESQRSLGVMSSTLGFTDRVAFAWRLLESVTHNWWQYHLMLGEYASVPLAGPKTWLLALVPLALWLATEWRGVAAAPLRVTVGCGVSFFAVSLVFGNRLGGHHYLGVLVLGYVALAMGIVALTRGRRADATFWPAALAVAPMVALAASSVQAQLDTRARLRETGGVGLRSDAIHRFTADAMREHRGDMYYFPDWGLMTPFAFLTGGTIELSTNPQASAMRGALCRGRDVHLALIEGDRAARLADWSSRLEWSEPARVTYRQRDGVAVFDIATWRGASSGAADPRCNR